jgi:hypothetical protein
LIFYNFRQRAGLSVDYAMPGIMATISALLGKSTVQSLNKKLGCCYYTLLAAQPSTGKSQAQELSQAAVQMIEQHFNVSPKHSFQCNAATVESFCRILSRHPSLICSFFYFSGLSFTIINTYLLNRR